METLSSVKLFGIKITTSSEEKILEYIESTIQNRGGKVFVATPNPEIIMYAKAHDDFRRIINEANVALPDGIGVGIASFLCSNRFIPRITGADFMIDLVSHLSEGYKSSRKIEKKAYKIGLFGGRPGVAERVADCLQKKYSGIEISYASDRWDDQKIKGEKIDVLFVALGFPKQEVWISENLKMNPVTVAVGVGGAFDFISGEVSRAPVLVRKVGAEWLYRLIIQPWRVTRQIKLLGFIALTMREAPRERFGKSS